MLLSGFELSLTYGGKKATVESVFQGSKVCANPGGGTFGPYQELYSAPAVEAKRDERLSSCRLARFRFGSENWELDSDDLPQSAFYDYLYGKALLENPELLAFATGFGCFTDLEYTPGKSDNCQAFSLALYVALKKNVDLKALLASHASFRKAALEEHFYSEQVRPGVGL